MENRTNETIEDESVKVINEEEAIEAESIEASADEIKEVNEEAYDENGEIKKTKYDVFGWIGFISGIVTLVLAVFGFGIFVFWIGIVFSCIGKKSIKNKKLADYGLLFSIFSLVIALLLFLFV